MIPLILAVAAVALYVLPLIVPKPPPPDDIALPPVPGGATPVPASGPSFPAAVSSLDSVIGYLVAGDRYGSAQADAARVLLAALVDAATPPALVQEEVLR
jgi:hypothetical protein